MEKKEPKKALLVLGICCFIVVGVLALLTVDNFGTLDKASKNAKPWEELYHCVDMRIGNHDDADLTQMKRYYSVLESNPYIYAALSENERDFFTADKSVLYNNLYSYECIIDAQKKTITFQFVGSVVFLVSGLALLHVYRKKKPREINETQNNGGIEEITGIKNNTSATLPKKENIEELKKFKTLLDTGAITREEFDKKKKELLGL